MTATLRKRRHSHDGLMWRAQAGGLCAAILCAALLAASAGPAAAAGGCENEAIREQQSSQALPECRAYEMVSPVGSAPSAVLDTRPLAAVGGGRFGYMSWNPYPGQGTEAMYLLSTRGGSGRWTTQSTTPPQGGLHEAKEFPCNPSVFYSAELTVGVLADGYSAATGVCDGDEPALVAGEPRGVANLFLRNNEDSSYQLIDPFPLAGEAPANAYLVDATPDLGHVVFSEAAALVPGAPAGGTTDVYEWSGGLVRLVSVLPDGTGVAGELANGPTIDADAADYTHALSADGEDAVFYAHGGGGLFVRMHAMQPQSKISGGVCSEPARACTVQVDAAQAGAEGSSGGGVFMDASADGSRVFFTDSSRLTTNATAVAGKPDLYEFDVATGALVDLTVTAGEPAADVVGYGGAGEDASYLYFVAKGVLAGKNSRGAVPAAGMQNLYVRHAGVTSFIATLAEGEGLVSRVSPSGQYLVFNSVAALTKFDNHPVEAAQCGSEGCREIFRYDAGDGELVCVSCAAQPTSDTQLTELGYFAVSLFYDGPELVSRNVLDDGMVFFDSATPLVSQATGGAVNVYEYQEGHVSLISSGSSPQDSEFLEAGGDGSDVFFVTDQSLVAADTDEAGSVYDARVNGGFLASSGEAGHAGECTDVEACAEPLSEPAVQAFGASKIFSGPGDLTPAETALKEEPTAGRGIGGGSLTRAQKLKRALKACDRRPKRRRAACRRRARKRFGPPVKRHGKGGKRRRGHGKRGGRR
jgi:hypothetical protein